MKSTVAIELIGNAGKLIRELGRAKGEVSSFGRSVRTEFDAIKRAASSVQGKLAGLGISLGTAALVKQSAQLDKQLMQIAQTAGENKGVVAGLRKELFTLAHEGGQQVETLAGSFNTLIQAGQSWQAAIESNRAINIAGAVTGANPEVLAKGLTVGAQAFNINMERAGQAQLLLDKMTVAGRLGNAELENLSDVFARVGVNAKDAGLTIDGTLGFVEALSKVEMNPERLATLVDSTLRVFTRSDYMRKAQKGTGVKFFDAQGTRRSVTDILGDIKKVYDTLETDKQRTAFIGKAFGEMDAETIKGLRTLFSGSNLKNIGDFASKIEQAGGTLKSDFADATNNLIDQAGRLKNVLREAADGFASPIKDVLSDGIKKILAPKEEGGYGQTGASIIAAGGLAVGGGYLLKRVGGSIGDFAAKLLGKGGSLAAGVAEGKALEAAAGVVPVFVTNWQNDIAPTGAGTTDVVAEAGKGIAKGGAREWLAKAMTLIGAGGMNAAAGMTLSTAGTVVAGAGGGYMVGMGLDKMIGAARGKEHALDDTRIGELIGLLGNFIASPFSEESRRAIEINMQIDQQGRVVTTSNDMQTKANVSLNRGKF